MASYPLQTIPGTAFLRRQIRTDEANAFAAGFDIERADRGKGRSLTAWTDNRYRRSYGRRYSPRER